MPVQIPNIALIILGMHRSGTSALTGVLSMAGADPGPSLMPAVEGNNPKGFWEHQEIVAIHERLLATIGFSWDDERPMPEDWYRLPVISRFRNELMAVLQRDFTHSPLWILKDPRLCRLMPLWLDILREFGATPHFVFCLRHPLEVAKSLERRNGLQEERACLLWLEYLTESERLTRSYSRIVVTYEHLLSDWRMTIRRVAEDFSLTLPIGKAAGEKIDAFLEADLRHHHRDQEKSSGGGGPLFQLAVEAYEIAANEHSDRIADELADIANETVRAANFVTHWATEIRTLRQAQVLQAAQLVEANAALQSEIEANATLQFEIGRIKSTISWKITKPLRFLAFLWRRRLDAGMALAALARFQNSLKLVQGAWRILRTRGLAGFTLALGNFIHGSLTYAQWIARNDTLSDDDRVAIGRHISTLKSRPLISVLMPVYNTPEIWLRRAVDSVREQLYPNWELCIADDASTDTHVWPVLEAYARLDERIRIVRRKQNGHISAASNRSLELARGQFVALLDPEDELAPHALYMVAAALDEQPWLDLLYSDEDKIDGIERRFNPYFKPDWNPDLFTAQNMVTHLAVYRTDVIRTAGGFREELRGAIDWDLALRVSEIIPDANIYHLPHVLYHQRYAPHWIDEKRDNYLGAKNAVEDYWYRQGIKAQIETLDGGIFRTAYPLPDPLPLVSIIVPTRNGLTLLKRCLDGLFNNTDYPAIEIIVVDNRSDDPATLAYLAELEHENRIRLLSYDAPFNFSAINNMAVTHAHGELICLLNNDVEPIGSNWLKEMVSHGVRLEIGAVGAMLYYPDDTIQHAGTMLNGIAASHLYQGQPRGISGDNNRARLAQNVSAVTAACLVVRKAIWEEVGGMEEDNLTVAFNDVDFCLKVWQQGYRNLWTPFAELYHHESVSRGQDNTPEKLSRYLREIAYLQRCWGNLLRNDPAWNPNLSLDGSRPRPAHSPRSNKPWRQFENGH